MVAVRNELRDKLWRVSQDLCVELGQMWRVGKGDPNREYGDSVLPHIEKLWEEVVP